jgi:hypothetical protein
MGSVPTAGGNVTLQTSSDLYVSDSTPSVYIGGSPSLNSFKIPESRLAQTNVSVSFSFIPTAGGSLSAMDTITLTYPFAFFEPNGHPTVSSGNFVFQASASSASSIVITLQSGTIPASAAVTISLAVLTAGNGTKGGNVSVSTSRDPLFSDTLPSGTISCTSVAGTYCPDPYAPSRDCPIGYYCPAPNGQAHSIVFPMGCLTGTYNNQPGTSSSEACIPCATGSYSAKPEQPACKLCPGATDTITTGSSSSSACIAPGFASIVDTYTYYEIAVFAAAALICYAVSSFLDRKYLGQQHLPIFFAVMSFLDLAMSMWFLFDTRPYLQVLAKRNNLFTAAPFSIGILISVGLLVILGWSVS